MKKYKIFLTGMMGSGKSSLGQNLADKLNTPFIDLDKKIEIKLKKNIDQIFSEFGEDFFRKEESLVLTDMIAQFSNESEFVCALGGGTIMNGANLDLIKRSGTLIFIDVNIKELVERLKRGKSNRPLLKNLNEQDLESKLVEIYNKRSDSYKKAHIIIENNSNNIDFVTDEIKKRLTTC
ncbi:MAG: shikimate kinase [Bacteriovoracaceae bacterium]